MRGALLAAAAAARLMALTFDDLPGADTRAPLAELQDQNRRMLAALHDAQAPAIGFVNEARVQVSGERDARVGILEAWLDAGCDLGNHTEAHLGLSTTPLREYEDGVLRGEAVTRALLEARGRKERYFRHPFTQTGPTKAVKESFEAFLADRGFTIAPFSIEAADYMFAALYADALAARLRDSYLEHVDRVVDFMEGLAADEFGHAIPQILLAHVNRLNADVLPDLLKRLASRGYRFVTLDAALADPAWQTEDLYVGTNGPSWLHRFSVALGKPNRLVDEPDPPQWVLDGYNARAKAPPPGR
jgi:peptidoglycan/xylan/chitin deacetylase (PgdA/CDA1 family)